MKILAPEFLVLPLVLSCAAPVAGAQSEVPSRAPARSTPIRFGDPAELAYSAPFFPGAAHDPQITTPDSVLGQAHGSRLAHHAEILACFRAWARESQRIRVETFGRTHEGRELVWAAIGSPRNLARLDALRADLARLADPRGLSEAEAQRILAGPAVAWMGYSIHGDELSGADAAVALGYHLVADTTRATEELLEQLVIVIDPCLNPDGRERIVALVEQSAGLTPNLDYASMHRGRWPYGRGNHYLFDMNRDWMAGSQPETRARWQAVLSFSPQLFVDAHEMGSNDTFLFYPQARPHNPELPVKMSAWQQRYAAEAARAFDARGWAYYSREWADAWGPFYSDSWASLTGATGILYEQASTSGFPLRRDSGAILTYREAVHHQLTASWANLTTLAAHRAEALADYLANGRRNVAADTPGNERMLVVRPTGNLRREEEFLRTLLGQGIEVERAEEAFEGTNAVHSEGASEAARSFPAGAWIVRARQPARQRVRAFLDFDVRYDSDSLLKEREELERRGRSKAYDVTSWSLPLAYDLDATWCDARELKTTRVQAVELARPALPLVAGEPAPVAWLVDSTNDDCLAFAARALELGLAVHASDEAFTAGGRRFARGSLLVRRSENPGQPEEVWSKVRAAAEFARVEAVPAPTGLAPDLEQADLGGQHFQLLARPRVALLANSPVSPDSYGHLWHHLDQRVGVPFTILDAQSLGSYDLRRYNVLIVPPSWGLGGVLGDTKEALAGWVEGGGTLIACDSSAAELTAGALGLSTVKLRQDALTELDGYARAVERERAARQVEVDESTLWNAPEAVPAEGEAKEAKPAKHEVDPDDDRHARLFAPQGATLRASVDEHSWITAGMDATLPVLVGDSDVFLAKPPVTTAVRLDPERTLRLSGLLWPEARARLADSAWLTIERKGHGQVILFASQPAFRGYHLASARLLANAVVLGPGLGTDQPRDW